MNTEIIKCEYCDSTEIVSKKVHGGIISICQSCTLGFNPINKEFDYENESDFSIESDMLKQWDVYARRDAQFIADQIKLDNKDKVSILEIGSGFGLVSNHLESSINVDNYFHMERNKNLVSFLKQNNKKTIQEFKEIKTQPIDYIILNHVLEHIDKSHVFLLDLINRFPSAKIILLQTNHQGFIPKYLPFFWYGWQLDQHYYHFTPTVFKALENKNELEIENIQYYKLDQKVTWNVKGIVKLFLKFVNLFVTDKYSDAFMITLRKKK